MNKRLAILPLVSVLALAGCQSTLVFTRPGTSAAQANADVARCEYENRGRYASAEAINPFFAIDEIQATKQCLALKGYTAHKMNKKDVAGFRAQQTADAANHAQGANDDSDAEASKLLKRLAAQQSSQGDADAQQRAAQLKLVCDLRAKVAKTDPDKAQILADMAATLDPHGCAKQQP